MVAVARKEGSLSRWRYQPFIMPRFAFIGLSALLIIFASAPFLLSPPRDLDAPALTKLRLEVRDNEMLPDHLK